MKKLFALLALVLGVVSCQTEPEGFDVNVGGEQDVNITVSLPESTRAASNQGFDFTDFQNNNNYDLRFILEIRHNDKVVREVKTTETTSATFPVRLAPKREYTFTVWADLVKEGTDADLFYNTADLNNITLKTDVDQNIRDIVELRDAYTHTDTFNFTTQRDRLDMTLVRPFAKVRVVATDLDKVTDFDINPAKGVVEYSEVYKAFNAVEGDVEGSASSKDVTYNIEANTYTEQTGQLTVFADYIFVPTAENTQPTVTFTLDVQEANDKSIKSNSFNTAIPVSRNKVTSIVGNVLTTGDNINVVINGEFGGEDAFVDSRNAAQSSLDNVIANTTIYLEPGVNYGTLYLRPVAGGAQTKVVDWIGNNYRFETYSLFENLTIVGAEGATVDAIKIEGGTYYNTDHSQKETHPIMLSLIELKNVVIKGVTFTGKGGYDPQGYGNAINLSGSNIKVDGLKLENCVLNNDDNDARLLYKTESTTHVHTYTYNGETYTFSPSMKDITVTGCTFNGGYMGMELRETENVTITNNEFNVGDRNILLASNSGCTYSGNVTITGNVSNNAKERFVRMSGAGDAVVVISNNTLNNYQGADADYIKVTDGNNVTIENNALYKAIAGAEGICLDANDNYVITAEEGLEWLATAVNGGDTFNGKTVKLNADIDLEGETFYAIGYNPDDNSVKKFEGTFDGNNKTIKGMKRYDNVYAHKRAIGLFASVNNATVKNIVMEDFVAATYGGEAGAIACVATGVCTFENIKFTKGSVVAYNNDTAAVLGWANVGNFTFKNIEIGSDVTIHSLWNSHDTVLGGVIGTLESGSTVTLENIKVACKLDAYNDVGANYQYGAYRRTGMLIGNMAETQTINGVTYPNPEAAGVTCSNVTVTYGDWMNYHYCEFKSNGHGSYDDEYTWKCTRVEASDWGSDAIDTDNCTHESFESHNMWLPVDQLFGGGQGVYGLREYAGVTVNYPESFFREQGYKAEGNTYTVYSGAGFEYVATEVLADASKNVTIELANDIDLAGIEWPAVSTKAAFVLDGKGYAIKNLTTSAVEDHGFWSTAMFTTTYKATTIKNLVVENATVTGRGGDNSHGAVLVACNYAALNIEGVTVKNSTVSNCDRSSALVTYLYFTSATVKNCVVEGCTVDSIGTAGALLGMNNSHDFEATGNTVKNTTISSSEGSNKAGILIGTWQDAGTLTESNNTVENSKAINAGTETNNNIGRHA